MGKKRYPLGVLLAGNAGPHGGASKYTTNGSLFRSLFMCRRKLILRLTNVDHSPQYNIVVRSYDYGGVAVAQGTILIMLMHILFPSLLLHKLVLPELLLPFPFVPLVPFVSWNTR